MKKQISLLTVMLFALSMLILSCNQDIHNHTFATEWSSDEIEHWHAATCEHTNEVSEKSKHNFGEWKVTKEATEKSEGNKERSCTVCEYTVKEVIEKKEHTHTFEDEWTTDHTYHYKWSTCGHDVVDKKAKHTFGEWKITAEATEELEGSKEKVCNVCGYKVIEEIEKLVHIHTFEEEWTIDENFHYKWATCGHDVVNEKAKHVFGEYVSNDDATPEKDGTKTKKCTVCEYAETIVEEGSKIIVPEGFVYIPAGTFQMGSNAGSENEKPVHQVTLTKNFFMGKYEVTQEEWESVMGSNPSYFQGEERLPAEGEVQGKRPVETISWYEVLVYCNKRSLKEGLKPCYSVNGNFDPGVWGDIPTVKDTVWDAVVCDWNANGYRLPTEAEWEYAARAGDNTVDSLTYSGTKDLSKLDDYAWHSDTTEPKSHEVGKKLPNAFGLYDMSGNVAEWCWNWRSKSYDITLEGGINPVGSSERTIRGRTIRGGVINYESEFCAVTRRHGSNPHSSDLINGLTGIRLVRQIK